MEKMEWRRQGTSITVRVEATEQGKCNMKWNQAHSCCLLLLPTAWNGARAGWGPGTGPGDTADHRGQEPVPAGQTNSQDQGRGCHSTGDMKDSGCVAG